MNTEITENIKGWVLYDGECAACAGLAARGHSPLARRGFHLTPLQADWVRACLGNPADEKLLFEMKLLLTDGQIFGGADALVRLARWFWWAWPVYLLAFIPGTKPLLRAAYRRIARRRHCFGGHCRINHKRPLPPRTMSSTFYHLP